MTTPEETASAGLPRASRRVDRLPPALWLTGGVAVGIAVWIALVAIVPAGPEQLPAVNRWLVRAGLPLFCLAFAATPLSQLWPSNFTRRLVRERRGIGLAWAMIHLIHATAIVALWQTEGESVPPASTVVAGGMGFVFTALLAATSNDASQRMLGRGWRRLHRTGIWYITFIFVFSYLGAALETGSVWKSFASALLLSLVGLRVVAAWRRRRS